MNYDAEDIRDLAGNWLRIGRYVAFTGAACVVAGIILAILTALAVMIGGV